MQYEYSASFGVTTPHHMVIERKFDQVIKFLKSIGIDERSHDIDGDVQELDNGQTIVLTRAKREVARYTWTIGPTAAGYKLHMIFKTPDEGDSNNENI